MPTTGLVEIVNITGLPIALCRNLQMLSARGVCALENSSCHQQTLCFYCCFAAAASLTQARSISADAVHGIRCSIELLILFRRNNYYDSYYHLPSACLFPHPLMRLHVKKIARALLNASSIVHTINLGIFPHRMYTCMIILNPNVALVVPTKYAHNVHISR